MPVSREEGLARSIMGGAAEFDEAFLVSDEHGVVPARKTRAARAPLASPRGMPACSRPRGNAPNGVAPPF